MLISKFLRNYSTISNCKRTMCDLENAKRLAAHKAVDNHISNGFKVGIGSGTTIVYGIQRLAERIQKEKLQVVCMPTSFQARQLLIEHSIPLTDLETTPELDVCIDGADEVDSNLTLIKGGGGCLLQEKIVASCAKSMIVVADYRKNSGKLGEQWKKGIPIEVLPLAYMPIKKRIESKYKGKVELRMGVSKVGPCVTDNGNFILDWKDFDSNFDWYKINMELNSIPGVVETGLFVKMAQKAYFGMADGSVKEQNL